MSKRTVSLAALVCVAASLAFSQTSYVFEVPGPNTSTTQIFGEGDNDFSRFLGPKDALAGATQVLAMPNGSGFYIVSPTAIQSASPSLNNLTTLSGITGTITAARLTGDGKYLVVLADHFYIITTANNAVATADNAIPFGGSAIDFAISPDSQIIWILGSVGQGSQSAIAAVSPSTLQPSQSQLLSYPATSMTLSPLGLLYVVYAADKVDEIDPATLSVTPSGHMSVPSGEVSGRLHFTPDGATAYSSNTGTCTFTNCFTTFQLNVASHSFTGVPFDPNNPAPFFDNIFVAGNNQIFGFTSSAGSTVPKLWDITSSPFSIAPTALALGIPLSIIQSVAISDERPTPRYLYILDSDLNRPLLRVGLTDGTIVPSTAAVGQALSFASIPAQAGSGTSFVTLNTTQTVAPGATSAALIAYATDSLGRPVYNQQVCFSTDASTGLLIASPSQTTNSHGGVQTYLTAPSAQGAYHVTLGFGPCGSASTFSTYTINVGTTSGQPTSSQISIYTGNGQLIRQFTSALQPLTVKILNLDGSPIAGAPVVFTLTGGPGIFSNLSVSNSSSVTATTDENGYASTGFTGGTVPQGLSFQATTVTATSDYGSVNFIETTQNASVDDPAGKPIFNTNNVSRFDLAQGQVIPALFTARTLSEKPPQSNVPIPNVGIRLADSSSATLAPSSVVACQGSSLGDDQGVSRCNVVGVCQPAGTSFPVTASVQASVGEAAFFPIVVTLTQGTASQLTIKSPDPQTGSPGNTFTLIALITDGCGQPVSDVPVTWSFTGSNSTGSSLYAASTASSPSGTVSAQVTLGNTPGSVQVQLSAGTVATAIFHLTSQLGVSSIAPVTPIPPAAIVNTAFGAVTFVVRASSGLPVANIPISFSLSGSGAAGATVNPASGTTNAQGLVQTNVVAGPTAGSIVVTASYATLTATVALTATLAGPQFTSSSFTNAASGSVGMTPCGLVTVRGSGLLSGVQGIVSGVNLFGPLPTTLAGVSITVQQGSNNIQVPIQQVASDQSGQRVTFQAPCELTATSVLVPGSASVSITANGATTTVNNVLVFAVQPGLFTFTGSNSKQYGVVIREVDGSYVTPENQAHRGDKLYLLVTGIGQVTPAATTNSVGVGSQNANVPMLVFLNNTALNTLSTRYLFGSIGTYLVEFQVPADFPVGTDLNILPVATANNGNDFIVGNTTLMAGVAP